MIITFTHSEHYKCTYALNFGQKGFLTGRVLITITTVNNVNIHISILDSSKSNALLSSPGPECI